VCPAEAGVRWSGHQYGDGTLCLEWGPDNWHPEVTAAQVLESAHRLLEIENPLGEGASNVAPSRHALTQGQELRGHYGRVYADASFFDYLRLLPARTTGVLDVTFQFQRESYTVLVQAARPVGLPPWADANIPPGILGTAKNYRLAHGLMFVIDLPGDRFAGLTNLTGIDEALRAGGYQGPQLFSGNPWPGFGLDVLPDVILLVDRARVPHFFILFGEENQSADRLALVRSRPHDTPRIPADLAGLAEKKVGIVGVGSLGARVALKLARMGARRFLLVDDDVFLPENVCRHPLDWRSVGQHKVDAVAEALDRIAPGMDIKVSRLNLTAQENTTSLNGILRRLGKRDLLLDMTANPAVFNLLAAVAAANQKPLVWAEVFGGGIGGLVGRSRPRKDPDPQTMRAAYHAFVEQHPYEGLRADVDYSGVDSQGRAWVASDATVGVLASHAADVAADALLGREPSAYPHSLYLVGLARAWVFQAPFHNIPIATDHLAGIMPPSSGSAPGKITEETAEFLMSLMGANHDGTSPS
jgi:hypothetical protein